LLGDNDEFSQTHYCPNIFPLFACYLGFYHVLTRVPIPTKQTTTEEDFYVGGAVVSVGEGTIIANESVFLFNKVEGGNGGVFLSNKRVELHGCHFIHNSALIGGVVYAAQLEVYNSTFETNEATAGGAIQITGGNSIIAGSKFMHNSAMLGAAVSVNNHSGSNSTGPTLTLLHSHFEEHAGVAVYVEAKHLVVDHCVFKYEQHILFLKYF